MENEFFFFLATNGKRISLRDIRELDPQTYIATDLFPNALEVWFDVYVEF